MVEIARHQLRIQYEGGIADEHALPFYDGTASIHGIAQALQIATHAYMSGEAVSRATAMRGAQMRLLPSKRGSFIFDIVTALETYPATSSLAVAIGAPVFYDFIKVAFKRATGSLEAEPSTTHLRQLYARREPTLTRPVDLDELAEKMEGSLQRAHRPIGEKEGISRIEICRPRGVLLTLDSQSKDWVNTQAEDNLVSIFTGNVTKFNSLSRNGRAYIDQLNRVIPFRPGPDFRVGDLPLLTWSLHGSNAALPKKLEFRATQVRSARGEAKRLLLVDCRRAPNE
jgi:hypothetical protein